MWYLKYKMYIAKQKQSQRKKLLVTSSGESGKGQDGSTRLRDINY